MSVSQITWEGEVPGGGLLPARRERVGRAACIARPGQKATITLGRVKGKELVSGQRLVIEPNIGANGAIVDLRIVCEFQSVDRTKLSTAITLQDGRPMLLPLGMNGGKSLGLVVEATVVDTWGASPAE